MTQFPLDNWGFQNFPWKGSWISFWSVNYVHSIVLHFMDKNLFSSLQYYRHVGVAINSILRGIRCRKFKWLNWTSTWRESPCLTPTRTAFQSCVSLFPSTASEKSKIWRYSWRRIHAMGSALTFNIRDTVCWMERNAKTPPNVYWVDDSRWPSAEKFKIKNRTRFPICPPAELCGSSHPGCRQGFWSPVLSSASPFAPSVNALPPFLSEQKIVTNSFTSCPFHRFSCE